jgi:hypothetical protein
MKCVPREEGKDILEEIHKGVCGNHASSRTLVSKAFWRAFYWPTALGDAEELVRRCQGCQYFAKQQHVPAYKLVTIPCKVVWLDLYVSPTLEKLAEIYGDDFVQSGAAGPICGPYVKNKTLNLNLRSHIKILEKLTEIYADNSIW